MSGAAATAAAPPRRTQRERREGTIARLVDATIESLLAVGYARTSVKEICQRAGVSHGGLFRHFESVLALVMAAAEEVAQRQLAMAEAGLARAADSQEPLVAALHQIRAGCRAPINAVFYELVVAARTDPELRAAMTTFGNRYAAAIAQAAQRANVGRQLPPELLPVLVTSALHLFDGEALTRSVLAFPQLEDQRMELLIQLARSLTRK
ncbi:MAG TPA: TetR/AcrR family transcriptional regulator [Solimonas sp.]|nr:TetR/AcrR family transcriptional regulator [Solimonas sp.]